MIETAKQQAAPQTDFRVMNMLDTDKHFSKKSFSLITYFGNTIPHLGSPTEVSDFFGQVYAVLSPGGTFIFQILNYDRILKERKCDFPVIKNSDFIFRRSYEFLNDKINFTIEMEIKGKKLSDSTLLYPLTKNQAIKLLKETGFANIQIYGDYLFKESDEKEFAALYVSEK
jgi:glycine/sarcosine N-methyltransferase